MRIITIEKDVIYAVHYPGQEFDEYNRIFEDHQDLQKVTSFFQTYKYRIGQYYVNKLRMRRDEVDGYAQHVIEDANKLEDYFEDLIDNSKAGRHPLLCEHFKPLEGFTDKTTPAFKSYGLADPSMLRVYAVEVNPHCMIIFYSGIKIEHSVADCPVLCDNVVSKADSLIRFLQGEMVENAYDLNLLISRQAKGG